MRALKRLIGVGGVLLAASATAAIELVPVAGATRVGSTPLPVQASAVTQQGQLISWQLTAAKPFSPGGLARHGRALCLLIHASKPTVVSGKVCIEGPAKGSGTGRLLYMKVTGNTSAPGVGVPATITRTSSRQFGATFLPSSVGLAYRPFYWQVISSLRAAACAPPVRGRQTCFDLYPPHPTRLKLHEPVLVGCQPRGPSLVYHGPSRGREIALTFDDGPWYEPPTIDFLHVLEREQVPATFFEIGRQVAPYDPLGAVEQRMLVDGDMIGDHTWSHPNMARLMPSAQRAQLLNTVEAIRRATGFTPCLWRPPYGAISPSLVKLARSLGLLTIMWNVDPRDWALPGVNAIYSNVVDHAASGAIVIQHFGGGPRYQTLDALPKEIATLRRRGYQFVTVAQLLGLRLIYR
ncbi:MAG TPA: polysaccharide deacetylase family protein [Solirubrobacteraceae bacterium]|nr:polysaccharide deacetylase family protein [Solirubrobacteraceae bacterium]